MAQMRISNTLWNDTKEAIIAFAEQLKDNKINWKDSSKKYNGTVDGKPDGEPIIPASFKEEENNKFQDKLNEFFLNHWADWQIFLKSKGIEGVIDTWRDIEEFLQGISDDEATTLMNIIADIEIKSGQLNIRMSEEIPGLLEAVTIGTIDISDSYVDDETGEITMIYKFE